MNISTAPSRLQLNERIVIPENADFSIYISKGSHKHQNSFEVTLLLEITVDDESGEDGAACPDWRYVCNGAELPTLSKLSGMNFDDPDDEYTCEAWFGNDAPNLTENKVVFGNWETHDSLFIRWSAVYDEWETDTDNVTFLFEGLVRFSGISLFVIDADDSKEDAGTLLKRILPSLDISEVELSSCKRKEGELRADWTRKPTTTP